MGIVPRVWLWMVRNTALMKISCDAEDARGKLLADLTAAGAKAETIEAVRTGKPDEYGLSDSVAIYGFDDGV